MPENSGGWAAPGPVYLLDSVGWAWHYGRSCAKGLRPTPVGRFVGSCKYTSSWDDDAFHSLVTDPYLKVPMSLKVRLYTL